MSDSAPCMIPKYAFRFTTVLSVCYGDSGIFIKWIRAGTSFTDCEILLAPSGPANVLHMLDVVTPLVPAYWSPQVVCAPWRWAYREEYEYTTLCESHDMLLSSCWVNGRITGLDGAMIEGRLKLWIKGKGWPSRCLAITPQSGADLVKTSHFANMLEQGAQRRACLFLLLADRCPLGTALSACIAHAPLIRRLGTLSIKAVYPGREEMRGLAGIANRAWDDPCLPGPINEHLAIEIDLSPGICTTEAIASLYACQASDTAWLRDLAYILLQLGGPLARYDLILPTLTDLAIHEDIEDDGYRDIRARWNAILQANINTIIEQTRANRPTGWRKIAKKGPRGGYRTRGGRTT